jgi:Brp/Blh family beta-carotene 15,15'-monooxygenase
MAVSLRLSGPVRATVERAVLWPAWALLALAAIPFLTGVSVPRTLQYAPFVASLLVFGLPHGAAEHVALARVGIARDRPLLAAVALYLPLMAVYAVAWWLAPALSFAFFILLTWVHWGQGDVYALLAFTEGGHLRTRVQRVLALVVRGGLPMLVPLVGHPERYRFVAEQTVGLFDAGAAAALAPAFTPQARLAVAVGFGAITLGALGVAFARRDGSGAWRVDAVETALLWGFFLVVPPVLAVGLYFCLWHSVRHIARLVVLDEGAKPTLEQGQIWPAARRFAVDAAPLTAGALVVFGALYALVGASATLPDLLGVYLVLLAVLTLPHAVVVALMDRRQAVWAPAQ